MKYFILLVYTLLSFSLYSSSGFIENNSQSDIIAEDVSYDNSVSGADAENVQDAIDELFDQGFLIDVAAEDVTYDNTLSGLVAEDLQEAVDELNQAIGGLVYTAEDILFDNDGTVLEADEVQSALEEILTFIGYEEGSRLTNINKYSLILDESNEDHAFILDADQVDLEGMSAITVEAWVKLSETDALIQNIVTKGIGGFGSGQHSFRLYVSNKIVWFVLSDDGTVDFSHSLAVRTQNNAIINDGQWYHVAFSVDLADESAQAYIDGLPVDTTDPAANAIGTPIFDSTVPVCVGCVFDSDSEYVSGFDGNIDEVRIWNDIRTDEEIFDTYRDTTIEDENLKAFWRFERDYTDSSGNENHLTAGNGAQFDADSGFDNLVNVDPFEYFHVGVDQDYETFAAAIQAAQNLDRDNAIYVLHESLTEDVSLPAGHSIISAKPDTALIGASLNGIITIIGDSTEPTIINGIYIRCDDDEICVTVDTDVDVFIDSCLIGDPTNTHDHVIHLDNEDATVNITNSTLVKQEASDLDDISVVEILNGSIYFKSSRIQALSSLLSFELSNDSIVDVEYSNIDGKSILSDTATLYLKNSYVSSEDPCFNVTDVGTLLSIRQTSISCTDGDAIIGSGQLDNHGIFLTNQNSEIGNSVNNGAGPYQTFGYFYDAHSIKYIPEDGADWTDPDPENVHEAIEVLKSEVSSSGGGNVQILTINTGNLAPEASAQGHATIAANEIYILQTEMIRTAGTSTEFSAALFPDDALFDGANYIYGGPFSFQAIDGNFIVHGPLYDNGVEPIKVQITYEDEDASNELHYSINNVDSGDSGTFELTIYYLLLD
jgi:hypothetical protein